MIFPAFSRRFAALAFCAASALAAPLTASAVAYSPEAPFSPMYETYSAGATNHLYTMNYSEAHVSTTSHGYANLRTAFYLERNPQVHTTPLYRYYKGAPQNHHAYATDTFPQDRANTVALGYTYEGVAGYIYTTQVPGSLPLYRLSRHNAGTSDRLTKFTTSDSEKNSLQASGWTYDLIQGYVPQTTLYFTGSAGIPGFPYLPGGHIMTRRCQQTTACTGTSFRNGYVGYRFVDSTTKPAGKSEQVMEFDLRTPDYFSTNQQDHLTIGMHGHWNIDMSDIDNLSITANNHHALGITIGASECGFNVRVEALWPTGNNWSGCNGQPDLQNNVTYRFRIAVKDTGYIQYTVTPAGSGTPIVNAVVNGNPLFNGKFAFPAADTGYFIVSATSSPFDYTVYMSNLTVTWH